MKIKITLDETIKKHKITRNAVAVEGKIRPATITELCNGKSKGISFNTLTRIIGALNTLTSEQHTINDVIIVNYDE